ncbi:hypothetical protein [Winogradskyella forsetii]|uniref:hypothetical protein n=1 Tax=Winogradskyella forsetii TaxID=2686077 RepID=UPI0015BFF8CD|nr:hypothetical protein [Winogradskyella forsetii]
MKRLRNAAYFIGLAVLTSSTFQCSSSRAYTTSSQKPIPFKVKTISFQEWNAGDNEENTGINVYVPIVDLADDIIIDSVYFRNFKGQLVRNYSRYTSVLRHNSLDYTLKTSDKENDYPFILANNECAISYVEEGEIKYVKLNDVIQKEAIYYKDGPPLAYQRRREAMIVSGEELNLKPEPNFQPTKTFKVKTISYQEWYAGIKVGGTGLNVFVPIVNKEEHIKIDSVYFRNLKAKLVENYGKYTAVLKNKSPYYTFKKTEKDKDFPFTLGDNECAISYVENGEIKYLRVTDMSEKAGTYYENGPPAIYEYSAKTLIASNDDVDEYPNTLANNERATNYVEKVEVNEPKRTAVSKKEEIDEKESSPITYKRRKEAIVVSREGMELECIKFEPTTAFKVKPIAFQEWYAGIKVGGTGMNVFVPIVNKKDDIKIDSIYFRNLKAKLNENYGRYTAVLKNKSPYYTFKKTEKDEGYPFDLADSECAISYVENGETKYIKVTELKEKRGVYYENGPPSIYENSASTILASIED